MAFLKVLVADDDPTTRCVVVEAVEEMGLMAIECANGRKAWEILQDNPGIRLLLADVLMPELDGCALVRIMRGNRQYERLPVIIMSAIIKPEEMEDILKLGHIEYIKKPFSVLGIQNIVERFMLEEGILNR